MNAGAFYHEDHVLGIAANFPGDRQDAFLVKIFAKAAADPVENNVAVKCSISLRFKRLRDTASLRGLANMLDILMFACFKKCCVEHLT